ncbi:MAG TPA: enoyl-ACP reductase [Firmicutes bacterium]|jgi:enoyl-[acyl-carrier protein] reductase I|nr:enoyl-ACP reductase [Bacillota bacterium]
MTKLLENKIGLIVGVANKRSIAWGIAQAAAAAGAQLVFTYQERMEKNVRELTDTLPGSLVLPCDVTKDEDIAAVMAEIEREHGKLDFLLHSVAYAPAADLENTFVNTSREGFGIAHDISAYSLVHLARSATPLMKDGGSILALTYFGAEKVIPGYNLMGVAKASLEAGMRYLASDLGPSGIRVNAISAGAMNTLAARGVSGFLQMRKLAAERAPLRRNVEMSELSNAAIFMLSDMSSAITGEVLHVDCGYNIMGM